MGNTVEILVKSRDSAKPDLEDLKAKLEELSGKVASARVEVKDAGDAAKLDRMSAKLHELDHRVANPKIKMAGALRAEADIHAVEASLDNLGRKEDEAALKAAALGEALGSSGGGLGSKLASLGDSIPLPALAALIPALGAVAVEVVGVASGFAAAGAGAVAFGALAMPAVKSVMSTYQELQAATQKYQQAQAKADLYPTKANKAAAQRAMEDMNVLTVAFGKMSLAKQAAVQGLQELAGTFGKMAKAFEPAAFRVFADGLKVINNLLPAIVPFANTFASVLDHLLQQAAKFTASKGFADWLKQFHSLEGPALNSIGQGIGKVAVAIGKLLTLMSGKDVAHAINILFGGIAGTINVVASGLHRFMQNWDGMSAAAAKAGHAVAGAFKSIVSGAVSFQNGVDRAFTAAARFVARFAETVAHDVAQVVMFFARLPGRIMSALGNLGSLLVRAGEAVIEGFLHGLTAAWGKVTSFVSGIAGWIASHKGPLEADRMLLYPHGQAIMDGLMGGMRSRMPALRSQLGGISDMIGNNPWPMPAGAGGRGGQLQVMPGGGSAFEQFMVMALRNYVRVRGGSVQSVLGH